MTGATDSFDIGRIQGKILSIEIETSASNTFKIYTIDSPVRTHLLGTAGAAVTVAVNSIYRPKLIGNLATTGASLGGNNLTNSYVDIVIDSPVRIDVASGENNDTWGVSIYYES